MDVYTRYFRVTTGPLIEAVKRCRTLNENINKSRTMLLQAVGANPEYYVRRGRLIGLTFPETPDQKAYKRVKGTSDGWYPKQNSKEGKDIAKAFASLKTKDIDDCLESVGLTAGLRIVLGGCVCAAKLVVIPTDPLVTYVTVPWYDMDPEKLEKYKKEREAGIYGCMSLDALLWEPTPEMTEIKGWEYMKAIQEWNDSLGMEEKYA